MPKQVLGVQMTPQEVCAVRLTRSWNRTVVDRVTKTGRRSSATLDETPAQEIGPGEVVIASLATDSVFHREFSLPFSDTRKIGQAAPLEAEESLPLPLEDLVCDVQIVEKGPGRSDVLLVAAPLERVDRLLSDLGQEQLSPALLDVDALALGTLGRRAIDSNETALIVDIAPHLCQAVLVSHGVARTFHAFSCMAPNPDLVTELGAFICACEPQKLDAVYLTGALASSVDRTAWAQLLSLPVSLLSFARLGVEASADDLLLWPAWAIPLGLALRGVDHRGASQVNLMRGPFALSTGAPPWKQTAIALAGYAGVLIGLWGISAWIEASQLETRQKALARSIRATFQAALPDVKNIVSEVDQLRTRVAVLEEQDRSLAGLSDPERAPLRILRNLAAKIPRDAEVEILDLSIDPEKVRIEGTTSSYRASERIKSEVLAASPPFSTVSSEARDGAKPGEVLFTLSVNLGTKR